MVKLVVKTADGITWTRHFEQQEGGPSMRGVANGQKASMVRNGFTVNPGCGFEPDKDMPGFVSASYNSASVLSAITIDDGIVAGEEIGIDDTDDIDDILSDIDISGTIGTASDN